MFRRRCRTKHCPEKLNDFKPAPSPKWIRSNAPGRSPGRSDRPPGTACVHRMNHGRGQADSVERRATLHAPVRYGLRLNKGSASWVLATLVLAVRPRDAKPASRWSAKGKPQGIPSALVVRCYSKAANSAAMSRHRKNSCTWSGAVSANPTPARRRANIPTRSKGRPEVLTRARSGSGDGSRAVSAYLMNSPHL